MKTLYIDINNTPIANTPELEVLSIDLKRDFYYSLGESVKGRVRGISSNIDLIADYMSSGEDAAVINQAWEQVKEILFSENPEEEIRVLLPQSYVDWLRYNNNEAYRNLYEQLYKGTSCISAAIDVAEIYEEAVGGTLFRKIKKRVEKDIEIEELVFNDNCVSRKSSIVRKLKEKIENLGFVPFEKWEGETMQSQIAEDVEEKTSTDIVAGHRMVDLGLSVCWADCNVGASSPEEYGGYYAWGETEEKDEYCRDNYKHLDRRYVRCFTKYCESSLSGNVDNKRLLDVEDDVAHMKWGDGWRMPTIDEIKELIDKCVSEWTSVNEVNGLKFTASNGNSIFLPAAGYRCEGSGDFRNWRLHYWSGTLNSNDDEACYLSSSRNKRTIVEYGYYRYRGISVRPVINKK